VGFGAKLPPYKNVTTRLLQKDVSENFEFPRIVKTSTLTSSEYKIAAEYNFSFTT
jgi:hypothetical protein